MQHTQIHDAPLTEEIRLKTFRFSSILDCPVFPSILSSGGDFPPWFTTDLPPPPYNSKSLSRILGVFQCVTSFFCCCRSHMSPPHDSRKMSPTIHNPTKIFHESCGGGGYESNNDEKWRRKKKIPVSRRKTVVESKNMVSFIGLFCKRDLNF